MASRMRFRDRDGKFSNIGGYRDYIGIVEKTMETTLEGLGLRVYDKHSKPNNGRSTGNMGAAGICRRAKQNNRETGGSYRHMKIVGSMEASEFRIGYCCHTATACDRVIRRHMKAFY